MCCFGVRNENLTKRVYKDGRTEFYLNNVLHNEDGPAVIFGNHKEWWFHGMRHREKNKPAIEYIDGSKEWWFHGMRHREKNKPAVIRYHYSFQFQASFIEEEYWVYDKKHRENGPAVIKANGVNEWWSYGIEKNKK
jgi:hypothetical protein